MLAYVRCLAAAGLLLAVVDAALDTPRWGPACGLASGAWFTALSVALDRPRTAAAATDRKDGADA